ncbi:MAG: hypothetical protein LC793_12905 [Thermomicrobia bacterium]|nr:hypothetical protein [Thermomicrobia bacterium]MCA1723133.1 hypothetical protein [Thermomicrobia bacterium]
MEGLARFRELGAAEQVAWTLYNLGMAAVHCGDVESAGEALSECLTLRAGQGNPAEIAKTIAVVAQVALLRGDAARAARLRGAVERIRAGHGIPAPTDEDGAAEQQTAARIDAALGTRVAADAMATVSALSLSEATALAHGTLSAP